MDWVHDPGYDPDRNLLNMCTSTIPVGTVDFVMSAGRQNAIVCFDCVSTACQRWWRGLGPASFHCCCHQIFSAATGLAAARSSLDYFQLPAFPALVAELSADARKLCADGRAECGQTENISQRHESENPTVNEGRLAGYNILLLCSVYGGTRIRRWS